MKAKFHLVFLFLLVPNLCFSATIISPNPPRIDGQSQLPFFPTGETGSRWQQVYGQQDFSTIAVGGGTITAIWFNGNVPFERTITNVQIFLSTTAEAPDSLSPVFAENIGFDETLVFGGPLVAQQVNGADPRFHWRIDLTTPFYYNPALGNLLLDVKKVGPFLHPPFPPPYGIEYSDSGTDRASAAFSSDVNSPTADTVMTRALLTMFSVTPIPEPNSVFLIAVAVALILLFLPTSRKA